jgi:hypothetical protein
MTRHGKDQPQGARTREQQQRIRSGEENTKGTDAPLPGETLKHAAMRYPKPGPGDAGAVQHGHRDIQRSAHDESGHRKRRTDE